MKKVIEVDGMCCKKCAERAERKLRLLDGVTNARANFKKQIIFVQTDLPEEMMKEFVKNYSFTLK